MSELSKKLFDFPKKFLTWNLIYLCLGLFLGGLFFDFEVCTSPHTLLEFSIRLKD
jgi:hypothetical protein